MPTISGGTIIEGSGGAPISSSGAPGAGTDEVQTITIGGTPTGGSFTLTYDGHITAAITWTATDATLVAAVDAALEALNNVGTGNVTAAAGTLTSGIGTITVTFVSGLGKRAINLMTATSSLTGTSPTVAVTETTPGVNAHGLGMPKGTLSVRADTGVLSINTGTALAPTWTVVGSQS